MKIRNTIAITLLLISSLIGQKPNDHPTKFDVADFNRKVEIADWLVEYDNVAWKTTDVITTQPKSELEKLGEEWFCFQDANKVWHAVYGKLTADKYEVVFHFEMDSDGKIARSTAKGDAPYLELHARALRTAKNKLKTQIPADSPRFNQYVRQNADKTFSVWMLPAFQPNGLAVYGGEAIYTIDPPGTKVIKDESHFQKDFRGFQAQPPREIRLSYIELDRPSLGAIFFALYYKSYFTGIMIDNSKSTSTLIKAANTYLWVHVEKDKTSKPQ